MVTYASHASESMRLFSLMMMGSAHQANFIYVDKHKYRELAEEFHDVGLLTGDVTINPNASCLVMTTEVLRSMLYRGSEVVREVAWLVYDEIHYLKDPERGVVWEESIILAPKGARFAFLSATIPNAFEFAEWVAKLHNTCVPPLPLRVKPLLQLHRENGPNSTLKRLDGDHGLDPAVAVVSSSANAEKASKVRL
eukprot:7954054-Pyramimonas_sp.AAC.3